MSTVFRCDICKVEVMDRCELMPAHLTLGLLSQETQNNFERIDLCLDCWPVNRRKWKDSFLGAMKRLVVEQLTEASDAKR